jgi:hypothetical protein
MKTDFGFRRRARCLRPLLLWALERGVNPDAFGNERTVVQLTLADQIEKAALVVPERGRPMRALPQGAG